MKGITLNEAKENYYPKPSHMAVKYADAFTLTPDTDDEHTRHVQPFSKEKTSPNTAVSQSKDTS